MFPQATGKLEIPSITYDGIVAMQNRNIDPFEAFFNGGSGYIEVKKQIKAPSITIQVDPLPQRPTNFSGGVGSFDISASIDKTEVKANEAVNLRVVVSGVGNMKLLKQPEVTFPKDFDSYDAKVTDKTKLTTNGLEGSIAYDFLAVPRHQGTYEIPPIEYVYFDTSSGSYKTLRTEGFTIQVAKGDGTNTVASFAGQEDVRQLANDIRYIHTGKTTQHARGDYFFGSTAYWTSLAVLLLAFVSLFIIFRRRAIENANVVKRRAGKANKVAVKRLKKAATLMKAGKANDFYDEVLRALWGFVGDKLNMPVEQLSRENISQQLGEQSVPEDIIRQFIEALDACEFARYAPGDTAGNMNKVYDTAISTITQIATTMKKKSAKKVSMLLLLLLLPMAAHAVTKVEADSAYTHEHYQQAAQMYEQLLKQGESSDLYYNLGNSYYRMDDITKAIINYERALLLSPGDRDIRINLQMARSKTIDKVVPESEMFFVTWYRAVVNLMSVDGWARTALCSLVVAIILALIYLFAAGVGIRKLGFFGALTFVAVFLLSNLFAFQQRRVLTNRTGAVIIRSAAPIKSTPAKSGTDLFILHEGTKVTITDGTMRNWKEIRVDDGKEGWVEASDIEVI
jgi:tetratricopeptide (TPR) repeat protein